MRLITVCLALFSAWTCCVYSQSVPNYASLDALEAWWSFEGNATDLSSNGHDGAVQNVSFVNDFSGNSNSSAYFYGTSDSYIQVNHSPNLNFTGGDDYSIAFRIRPLDNPDNGAHSGILTKWNENQHTTSYPYRIATTDLGNGTSELVWVNYSAETGIQNILSTVIINDRYVHIAYVVRGNTVQLYKNGYFESELEFAHLNYSNTQDILIGKRSTGNNRRYSGNLDELGIWSRALSECEVRSLATQDSSFTSGFDVVVTNSENFQVTNTFHTADSYQWYACSGSSVSPITGAINSNFSPQSNQDYYGVEVFFSDINCSHFVGCFSAGTLSVEENIGDVQNAIKTEIILYPNPADDFITLDFVSPPSTTDFRYFIYTNSGALVQEGTLHESSNSLEVVHFNPGVYFIHVPGMQKQIKFIKR